MSLLSDRIAHLRDATNDTFITSSNIYNFIEKKKKKKERKSKSKNKNENDKNSLNEGEEEEEEEEMEEEVTEKEHLENSIRLVVNHLELASLIIFRAEPDAVVRKQL